MNKGLDFIGINHYTGFTSKIAALLCVNLDRGSKTEGLTRQIQEKDGVSIGKSVCAPSQDTIYVLQKLFLSLHEVV
jgi:hypothetical protein